MTHAEKRNHPLLCIIALAMVVCSVFITAQPIIVLAAENDSGFYATGVLEDLYSSSVNGKEFDITQYPYDENGELKIITFVEYCYSFRSNQRGNYALYIYVYNPRALNLSVNSKSNKIQMAVAYDNEGVTVRYEKFNLEFCSKVESGDYKNLFYKFKVIDRTIDGKTFVDRVNSNARRYDVSGIELLTYGAKTAVEYGVGGTYIFTGYAAGYGPDKNAKSSLSCSVQDLETLALEVHHTNFRTNVSSLGPDHYNEVNTVYFSIPERIYEQYGHLQKIRAEWWEYKTKMAAITSNRTFYTQLLQYAGTDVGEYSADIPVWLYSGYSGQISGQIGSPAIHRYDWVYNKDMSTKYTAFGTVSEICYYDKMSTILPYVFYSSEVNVDSVFKFLYSDPIAGDVDSTQVEEYIYSYKNGLGNGYIDCNGKQISQDLFETYVDDGRTMGYNDKTIDLSDTFDLNSYDSNHSWWDKLWDYGFSWPATNGDYKDVAPICEVKASDFSGSDADISARLLVNSADVTNLKNFYNKETQAGNRVVLFRFANTDYYCAPAFTPNITTIQSTDTYVAQETLFLDFDIIELTFQKDGVYHVIPVVSTPIDIVNGFSSPSEELQWWKIALAVILAALLIILLAPVLPYIFRGIGWVIMLPVNMIKAIKNNREKEPEKDYEDFDDYYKEE